MKNPVRVTISGAAGNIGYALAFRVAAGDMLGPDQPVILQLLEITPALDALKGVAMELNDHCCAASSPLTTPMSPSRTAITRSWSVPVRAAPAWSARICSPRTAPSSARRARR